MWTVTDRLSIIWKSDHSDETRFFFKLWPCWNYCIYVPPGLQQNVWRISKKVTTKTNITCCIEQILEAAPDKIAAVWTLIFHFINYPSKMNKTCWILLKKYGQTPKQCSLINFYIWTCQYWPISKDLQTTILCWHSMLTCLERWTTGTDGERESRDYV